MDAGLNNTLPHVESHANTIDISDQRFGTLVAKYRVGTKNGCATWLCKCDCGREIVVKGSVLRSGEKTHCGSAIHKPSSLIGMRFGKLLVTGIYKEASGRKTETIWKCLCDCGNGTNVPQTSLTSGNTKSCGCLVGKLKYKAEHPSLYSIWCGIKDRCFNRSSTAYRYYGGRGITLCDDWLSFERFAEWSLSHGYRENKSDGAYTIDRINVNGGYNPANCRWTDAATQAINKTTTVHYSYRGTVVTVRDLEAVAGICQATIRARIKRGWTVEDAAEKPVGTKLIAGRPYSGEKHMKPVSLVSNDGYVIATFKSLRDACTATGCSASSISQVCNGVCDSVKGHKFKFADSATDIVDDAAMWFLEHSDGLLKEEPIANAKPVRCIETGVTYKSVREAASSVGVVPTAIGNAIHKGSRMAGGYHWEFYTKE